MLKIILKLLSATNYIWATVVVYNDNDNNNNNNNNNNDNNNNNNNNNRHLYSAVSTNCSKRCTTYGKKLELKTIIR